YIPSTTYYLKKNKGTIYVYDESGNHLPDYVNDEVTISWTTPSVEEVNLPLLTGSCYESPKLGVHNDHSSPAFEDGGTYSHIDKIEYRKITDTYEYEGNKYNVTTKPDVTWKLYDVTSGSRVFIKDIFVCGAKRETTMWDSYYVTVFDVHSNFYAGHTYEIVLEENGLTSSNFHTNMINYLRSEEMVIRIVGSKQLSEPELLHKSISDNEKVDALYTSLWVFDGEFDLKEGAKVGFSMHHPNWSDQTYYYPLSAEKDNGKTYVSASFISKTYATPKTFTDNMECKIIFPANVFTLAGMESIPNKEIVTTFTGVVKNTSGAEMVNVSLNINGVHSTSYKAVKGLPVTFTLAHDSNWIAESVSHNGTEVAYKDGIYTTTSLFNQENKIEAKLRFAVESLVDGTTGVAQLPDSNITVYTEQQHVIISGLTGNEAVSVYSMNGMLVNEHTNNDYTDLRISVAPGIYVVLVVDADGNRKAAKVKVD
ncbi:MAG: T9SS type A sorting domain-containing protein, partial [Muribaculaceae bacterium]|nr:T9SS type A sorting domain-containing protein [Muribaculaceae bacterium]